MNKVGAVLLDTRGIQKYVFASNKMKTNIGASYLVDTIFLTPVRQVLDEMNMILPEQDWRDTKDLIMEKDDSITAEIAYIGGGNMLILFRSLYDDTLSVCRDFVSRWSEKLLVYTPGLQTGAAVDFFDLDNFKSSLDRMYEQLKQNQSNIMPQVDLPYTGLSLECDYNGKTANVFSRLAGNRNISAEIEAKLRGAAYADVRLKKQYSSVLEYEGKTLQFVEDINQLGYKEGESYITVIHIDGNNMGVKFSQCVKREERKDLSIKVAEAVKTSFGELIGKIKKEYLKDQAYNNYLDFKKLNRSADAVTLPIRPIIIGGDDITLITPGRLGLHFAECFIRNANRQLLLTKKQQDRVEQFVNQDSQTKIIINPTFSCCAGVAIVPAKYPFFRAYNLAEELCGNAKKCSRQDDSSWLDFVVLHGDTYPALEMLWENQYNRAPDEKGRQCFMHYGPYRIDVLPDADSVSKRSSLQNLFNLHAKLQNAHRSSANKIKMLREVLFSDRHTQEVFLENDYNMVKLLKEESVRQTEKITAEDFWEIKLLGGKEILTTRYIDAIEIENFVIPGLEGINNEKI